MLASVHGLLTSCFSLSRPSGTLTSSLQARGWTGLAHYCFQISESRAGSEPLYACQQTCWHGHRLEGLRCRIEWQLVCRTSAVILFRGTQLYLGLVSLLSSPAFGHRLIR